MNIAEIRKDFPVLHQEVYPGKPLVYLDNAATTQKPRQVIEAVSEYYKSYNANVHRAIHALGEKATESYEAARAQVARFIDAPSPQNIVFTKNASESINLVAYAWGRTHLREGDEILVSPMEHHSNLVPWQQLALRMNLTLRFFQLTDTGQLDLSNLDDVLTESTKLVAVTQASNVLGTINPVREIVAAAHRKGAVVLVDAAQSVPHMQVSVEDIDCDFLAFSGHKMCGPTGIGVLYGKKSALENMDPFLFGGEMISTVSLEESTWGEVPHKFEAGTPNIAGAIGLGAAIDYLESIGLANIQQHEQRLVGYAMERLEAMDGLQVHGPTEHRAGLVSFYVDELHPHDLATFLDQEGVAIRAGHHCAQPLMKWLKVPATARASFYLYNTEQEVDILIEAVKKTREFFAHAFR